MAVVFINSLLGALTFRALGVTWRDSFYAGVLLAQLGEFSIVLALTAYNLRLTDEYICQLTLSVVALTMLITTLWIAFIRAFLFKSGPTVSA